MTTLSDQAIMTMARDDVAEAGATADLAGTWDAEQIRTFARTVWQGEYADIYHERWKSLYLGAFQDAWVAMQIGRRKGHG